MHLFIFKGIEKKLRYFVDVIERLNVVVAENVSKRVDIFFL